MPHNLQFFFYFMLVLCQFPAKGLYEFASLQSLATPLNPTFEQFEQENWKIGFVGHPLSILNIINRGGPTFFINLVGQKFVNYHA